MFTAAEEWCQWDSCGTAGRHQRKRGEDTNILGASAFPIHHNYSSHAFNLYATGEPLEEKHLLGVCVKM